MFPDKIFSSELPYEKKIFFKYVSIPFFFIWKHSIKIAIAYFPTKQQTFRPRRLGQAVTLFADVQVVIGLQIGRDSEC
jgi:hypothetical protein